GTSSGGSYNQAPDPTGVGSAGHAPTSAPPVHNTGAVENLIGRTIADVERTMILNTLDHCLGNRTHAANILGISIRTLRNKLNQYKDEGVHVPEAAGGGG
ncbi:MAG: sigma-54-dependent Fis family transcriptional regulator, partial [Alphaproteobacteria bacterium]|nr:sigma-54-dependent Fis family transcriptional regulator [Alphaproteobacteria bacterium]